MTTMDATDDSDVEKQHKIENHWYTRNNSSSVSAALNSELYNSEYDTKPLVVSKQRRKLNKNPKCPCTDCYCRNSPVYPKLNMQLSDQSCYQRKQSNNVRLKNLNRNARNMGKLEDVSLDERYLSQSMLLGHNNCCTSNKQCKSSKWCHALCLTPTTPRKIYEEFKTSKENEQDSRNSLQKAEIGKKIDDIEIYECNHDETDVAQTEKQKMSEDASTAQVTNEENATKIISLNSEFHLDTNLKKLNTFRKENYFDCHSTKTLSNLNEAEHRCIHKFILNNRFILQPQNPDPFGTSRCAICDKSIKFNANEKYKPKSQKVKTDRHANIFKALSCSQNLHEPNPINVTSKNDLIEIKIPYSFDVSQYLSVNNVKIKHPFPLSSLALRQQKVVVA